MRIIPYAGLRNWNSNCCRPFDWDSMRYCGQKSKMPWLICQGQNKMEPLGGGSYGCGKVGSRAP